MGKYNRKRSNRRGGRRPAKSGAKKTLKKSVTEIVKSVVQKRAETKYVMTCPRSLGGSVLNSFTGFTQAITGTNEIYNLIPFIAEGNASHQREGDSIRPLSLTLKGRVVLDNRVSDSVGIFVHIYLLTAKCCKSLEAAGTAANVIQISRLLDNGDSTKASFTGSYFNSQLAINRDEFNVIKHDVIHLVKGGGNYNSYPGGGSNLPVASPYPTGQNGRNFSYKIPCPDVLKYTTIGGLSGGPAQAPHNYYPFMVVGWTYDDSYADQVGNSSTMVNIEAMSHLYFQDPQ